MHVCHILQLTPYMMCEHTCTHDICNIYPSCFILNATCYQCVFSFHISSAQYCLLVVCKSAAMGKRGSKRQSAGEEATGEDATGEEATQLQANGEEAAQLEANGEEDTTGTAAQKPKRKPTEKTPTEKKPTEKKRASAEANSETNGEQLAKRPRCGEEATPEQLATPQRQTVVEMAHWKHNECDVCMCVICVSVMYVYYCLLHVH